MSQQEALIGIIIIGFMGLGLLGAIVASLWALQSNMETREERWQARWNAKTPAQKAAYVRLIDELDRGQAANRLSVRFGVPFDADDPFLPNPEDPGIMNMENDL